MTRGDAAEALLKQIADAKRRIDTFSPEGKWVYHAIWERKRLEQSLDDLIGQASTLVTGGNS